MFGRANILVVTFRFLGEIQIPKGAVFQNIRCSRLNKSNEQKEIKRKKCIQ